MANISLSTVLCAVGGDVLQKYGTLVKRSTPPGRGGEIPYTFTRTGPGLYVAQDGNVYTAATGVPRIEWAIDPVTLVLQPYLLLEGAATNVVLRSRDLSNAAWTKTTMTALLDQVGIDGGTNTASSLLATAGNATCLQAITLGSSARFQSAWVKRLVGSGAVQMTTDNGATWTTVTVTAGWTRVNIPTQTLANPTVGFRLVTIADKIAVDGVQNETGLFQTSTIFTTTGAVTRNAELFTVPVACGTQALWLYVRFVERGTALAAADTRLVELGAATSADPRYLIYAIGGGNQYAASHIVGGVQRTSAAPLGGSPNAVTELLALLRSDGSVQLRQAINGGADNIGTQSATNPFGVSWSGNLLSINSMGNGTQTGYNAYSRIVLGTGAGTTGSGVTAIPDVRNVL